MPATEIASRQKIRWVFELLLGALPVKAAIKSEMLEELYEAAEVRRAILVAQQEKLRFECRHRSLENKPFEPLELAKQYVEESLELPIV